MKDLIYFEHVSKEYKTEEQSFYALNDISFSILEKELVVILGPSGAGKSTLLNIMGGMDTVTSGKVIVNHCEISSYSQKELTQYRADEIGFIFQFYNILPTLTVKENVDLIQDINKNAKDSDEVLKKIGLYSHRNKFPNQLSGGEQQRVSIARAIAKNPKILLCDEPTGALDSHTGVEVLKLLKKCTNENTVVIVTHNALFAEIADRVIRLKNGKIIENKKNEHPKKIDEVNW